MRVKWTQYAKNQLREIFSYYKNEAGVPIAKKLVVELRFYVDILESQPTIGQKELVLSKYPNDFRYLVYKNYKIIYWQNKDLEIIEIVDVFDARQDPKLITRNK